MKLIDNMKQAGCSEEIIRAVAENPEFENIEKIISESDSLDQALEKLHETYPDLDITELKKACNDQNAERAPDTDSDEMMELDEDDLEAVAGGTYQFGLNWQTGLGIALGGIAGAALAWAFSRKQKTQTVNNASSSSGSNSGNGSVIG